MAAVTRGHVGGVNSQPQSAVGAGGIGGRGGAVRKRGGSRFLRHHRRQAPASWAREAAGAALLALARRDLDAAALATIASGDQFPHLAVDKDPGFQLAVFARCSIGSTGSSETSSM